MRLVQATLACAVTVGAAHAQTRVQASLPTCGECTTAMDVLVAFGKNATTAGGVVDAIKHECGTLFHKHAPALEKICDGLASALNVVPEIEHALEDLHWPDLPTAICSTLIWSCDVDCCVSDAPEQIRLSLYPPLPAQTHTPYAVDWVQRTHAGDEAVRFWLQGEDKTLYNETKAAQRTYTDGGWRGHIFHASLDGETTSLMPGATYEYIVGSPSGEWSAPQTMRTMPAHVGLSDYTPDRPFRMAVIGDMGWGEASRKNIALLTAMATNGEIDLVLHNGDVGYADGFQRQWDVYQRLIAPITSRVPYMTTAGNHEFWFNFTAYKTRFMSPSFRSTESRVTDLPMYWQVPIHTLVTLIGGNSETAIDTAYISPHQHAFLKAAIGDARAAGHGFTIAAQHRPLYCASHHDTMNCKVFADVLRVELEPLYQDVDLVVQSHVHLMTRSFPLKYGVVTQRDYFYPTAPTYVTMGASGNREGNHNGGSAAWKAWGSKDVGFGLVSILDNELQWRFMAENNTELDSFTIVKKVAGGA